MKMPNVCAPATRWSQKSPVCSLPSIISPIPRMGMSLVIFPTPASLRSPIRRSRSWMSLLRIVCSRLFCLTGLLGWHGGGIRLLRRKCRVSCICYLHAIADTETTLRHLRKHRIYPQRRCWSFRTCYLGQQDYHRQCSTWRCDWFCAPEDEDGRYLR